jgi:hypothetical protein
VKQNNFSGILGGDTYNHYKVSLRAYLIFISSDHDEYTSGSFSRYAEQKVKIKFDKVFSAYQPR